MNKKRLDYIDILKGIAILLVIFSHSGAEEWMMTNMGDFFVALFFIASGYTYKYNNEPFSSVFLKRSRRLLKPYFFFSLVMLVLYKRFALIDFFGVLYSRYCIYPYHSDNNIILMGGGNPPLWFLTSMLTAFVPFYFLMKYETKIKWLVVLFIVYTYVCQYLPILLPWSLDTACLTAAFIYTGVLLRRNDLYFEKVKCLPLILMIAFALVCWLNGGDNLSVREYGNSFMLYYLGSVLATLFLLWVSKNMEKTFLAGLLIDFGRHSLVIFCIQMFLLRICHQVFHSLMHFPTEGLIFYIISFVKVLLVAVVGMYISKALNRFMPWLLK